jgi:hypothetical protein
MYRTWQDILENCPSEGSYSSLHLQIPFATENNIFAESND